MIFSLTEEEEMAAVQTRETEFSIQGFLNKWVQSDGHCQGLIHDLFVMCSSNWSQIIFLKYAITDAIIF